MPKNYNASIDVDDGLKIRKPKPPKQFTPFPVDLLPEPLRSIAIEGAESIRCDPSLIVLPMLAAVGAAIGNARKLTLKSGWHVSSCLWTMVIAESGTAKTPALQLAKKPLEEIEREANRRFDEADALFEADFEEYEVAKKQYQRATKKEGESPKPPAAPTPERHVVKDTTLAALVEILRDNPRGLFVPADELAGWFGGFNKHDQGGGDAQQWLSIYSGESISVDRKGNRNQRNVMRPTKVHNPFVAITGAIQPGLWHSTLGAEHQASGMAARFLMAWPPRRGKVWADEGVSESKLRQYADLITALVNHDPEQDENDRPKPKFIGMNHQAKKLWVSYFNSHNVDHLDRFGSLAAASSKIEEIPARLALIFHTVRLATDEIDRDQIDADTMKAAIAIARWFMAEAERVYEIMDGEAASQRDRELVEWIRLRGGSITVRDLQRGQKRYDTTVEAEEDLNRFAFMGWGEWETVTPGPSGGRPTRTFTLATVDKTPSNPEEKIGYVIEAAEAESGLETTTENEIGTPDDKTLSNIEEKIGCVDRRPEHQGDNDEIEVIF